MATIADLSPAPAPERRRMWRLLNESRVLDPGAVRVCCIVLALAFGGMVVLRIVENGRGGFLVPRAAMMAYAFAGAIAAPSLGWYGLRAFTVGLALMLPLTASYVIGMEGYAAADVAFCALATFVPYIFLLCGWDFLIASALLILGHVVVFHVVPDAAIPRWTLWGIQLSAMACGTAAGLLMVTFRGLISESREWWQASHARERTLREFAEVASAAMTSDTALTTLAEAFTRTVPGSVCAFVFEEDDGQLQHAALAGATPQGPKRRVRVPPAIATLARDPGTEVRTHRDLPAEDLQTLAAWIGGSCEPRGAALLPLGGLVPGVIILLVPDERTVTSEALLMWTAMAHESAIMVANLRAWSQLRSQEAQAREVSAEREAIAEMRSRFVTQASHEFRTPLAVILAATGSLERYDDRLDPAQRRQKLERIRVAVGHMTDLLNDVLALGQAEALAREGTRQATDLRALCQSAIAEVQDTALASHKLALQCQEDSLVLTVDPTLIRGVVSNLLTNAVKYSPAGGAVDLSLERRNGNVVVRVRDHGIGIPEEGRDQLFESFWRAGNVGGIPGSGLGLAIVERGVAAHGGTIHVDSTVGVGTTIEIIIPAEATAGATGMP